MKSLARLAAADAAVVEVHEWITPHGGSRLVSNFARAHILISLFDGDPDKWLEFIQRDGTDEERANEIPFVMELRRRAANDPKFIERLRDAVHAVSSLLD
jgi:hypothetical protein